MLHAVVALTVNILQGGQVGQAAVFEAVMTFLEQQWQIWCSADLPVFKQRYVCQYGCLVVSFAMVTAALFIKLALQL